MGNHLKSLILCFVVCFSGFSADPVTQNQKLGRGINLGNALEARGGEGAWGVVLKGRYFKEIADAGFNSVRIPANWTTDNRSMTTAPYTISSTFFDRVDWAIDSALDCGLMVVLDMHHYDSIFTNPYAEKPRFLAMWSQIASHYQSYSDNLIFEPLNEPNTNLTIPIWNEFLEEVIDTIRTTNPTRTLIVGCAEWGNLSALNSLVIPPGENNVIVTVHYYEPFPFTHQGAEWTTPVYPVGTKWNGTTTERNAIINHFSNIKAWSTNKNIPVYIGEFGAYEKADMPSRKLWTDCVARTCEANGFSWSYWEFCSSFGAYNDSTQKWRTDLITALQPPLINYDITITQAPNGTITVSPQKVHYTSGEKVTITASANTGYKFNSWTGDISGKVNPYTLIVNNNFSISAAFISNVIDTTGLKTVLDDFETIDTVNILTHPWFHYTDRTNFGNSTITNATMVNDTTWSAPVSLVLPTPREASLNGLKTSFQMGSVQPSNGGYSSKYSAKMSYVLDEGSLTTYDPLAGLGVTLNADNSPVDISSATGIGFWYKSNRSFKVECITSNIDDYAYYNVAVPAATAWTYFSAVWADFDQPPWGDDKSFDRSVVKSFQFVVQDDDGTTGSVFIDNFEITGAPAPTVDNCEDGDNQTLWGGFWFTFDDSKDGGLSSVVPHTDSLTPFTMNSTGSSFPNYIGTGTALSANGSTLDLTGLTAISFWARASTPMTIRNELGTANITDYGYYRYDVNVTTEWKKYIVPVGDMQQPLWASVTALDLTQATIINWNVSVEENPLLDNATGEFWLDDIVLYGCQSGNQPPSVVSSIPDLTVEEDHADTIHADLNSVFHDYEDGNALKFAVKSNTTGGAVTATISPSDSTLVLGFTANTHISDGQIVIMATDINGLSCSDTFSVTVTPVNDKPVINAVTPQTIQVNTSITLTLAMISAVDIDGDALQIVPGNGLNYTVSGSTITPVTDFAGDLSVPVSVSDGSLSSDPVVMTITVKANHAPILTSVTPQTINEDNAITITFAMLDASDPDGDNLSIVLGTASHYTVSGASVSPEANFNGVLSVPVKVFDGFLFSEVVPMSITINAVNDKPVLSGVNSQTIKEDSSLALNLSMVTASDVEGSALKLVIGGGNNYTVLDSVVTPIADFNGTLNVPVQVSDGSLNSESKTMVITVTAVNDAPVLTGAPPQAVNEDIPLTLTLSMVTASDKDGDALTVIAGTGSNYTVTAGNTITPDANFNGTLSVPVHVSDGALQSASLPMTITVNAVNDVPVISAISNQTINEDDHLLIAISMITITDVDNTTFTASAGAGSNYTVQNGNEVIPAPNFSGTLSVPVSVSDGTNVSAPATMTITVTPVNDAPVLVSVKDTSILKNTAITITASMFSATDQENDALHIVVANGENYSVSEGTVITPAAGFIGMLQIPVSVSDGIAGSNSLTMKIDVKDLPNSAPEINSVAKDTTSAEIMYTKTFTCTDADGDPISWQMLKGPYSATINPTNGQFSWNVSRDSSGRDIILQIAATDVHGAADTIIYSFFVEPRVGVLNIRKTEEDPVFHFAFGPNPASILQQQVSFTCPVKNVKDVSLSIYDQTGTCIHHQKINGSRYQKQSTGTWNLKTDRGRNVGTGTYLGILSVIYNDGSKKVYKSKLGIR